VSQNDTVDSIPMEQRQAIFLAVVEAQDTGMSVEKSRKEIVTRFGVTVDQIKSIEKEGLAKQWPPL
jgi:hypothetical protein